MSLSSECNRASSRVAAAARARGSRIGTLGLIFGVLLLATAPRTADAEDTIRLRFSSPLPEAMTLSQGVEWWANEVEQRSAGRVKIETFHGGSLLGAVDTLSGLQDGRIELGYMTAGYWPAQFPLWNVVGVPFLTSDPGADMRTWVKLYEENPSFHEEFDAAGVRPLFFFALSRTVFGTAEPTSTVDALSGKRLRAIGYIAEMLRDVGAEPVALGPPQVYESIQRGVLNGFAGWPFDLTTASGLHEVAPNMFDPGVGQYTSSAIAVSARAWTDLPEDVRDLLLEVGRDYMERSLQTLAASERRTCETLIETGANLQVWPTEAVQALRDRVGDSVLEAWRSDAVENGVESTEVDAFLDAYRSTYRDELKAERYDNTLAECAKKF